MNAPKENKFPPEADNTKGNTSQKDVTEALCEEKRPWPRMRIASEFVGKNCYRPILEGWTGFNGECGRVDEFISIAEREAAVNAETARCILICEEQKREERAKAEIDILSGAIEVLTSETEMKMLHDGDAVRRFYNYINWLKFRKESLMGDNKAAMEGE